MQSAIIRCIIVIGLLLGQRDHAVKGLSNQADGLNTDVLTRFLQTQMRLNQVPGLAISITQAHKIVYMAGFGLANKRGEPITPQTPFVIASLSKSFTALAILQLADAGQLNLDTPLQTYLPHVQFADPTTTKNLTPRHLLNQISGLPAEAGFLLLTPEQIDDPNSFARIQPPYPPGIYYEYSNLNYLLLGQLVEAVSGQSYAAYLQTHIFDPLAMSHSYATLEQARAYDLAQGHQYLFGWPIAKDVPLVSHLPLGSKAILYQEVWVPAGYIIASAKDMAHYLQLYLNQGHYREQALISPESLALMFQPWHQGLYGDTGYGMGWAVQDWAGQRVYSHNGVSEAYNAMMVLLPEIGYGVTILSNVNTLPSFQSDLMDGVIHILLGQEPRFYWPTELSLRLSILFIFCLMCFRLGHYLKLRRRIPPNALKDAEASFLDEIHLGSFLWRANGLITPRTGAVFSIILELSLVVGGLIYAKDWFGVPFNLIPIAAQPDLSLALAVCAILSLLICLLKLGRWQ